jgi:hypothetical protein
MVQVGRPYHLRRVRLCRTACISDLELVQRCEETHQDILKLNIIRISPLSNFLEGGADLLKVRTMASEDIRDSPCSC